MSDRQEGSGWWLASDGRWYPPESHPSVADRSDLAKGVTYAGFWLRFVAWLIDLIILSIGTGVLTNVMGLEGGLFNSIGDPRLFGAASLLDIVGGWLYYALMESSAPQATLGKMAMSVRVTDLEGERVSFGRATGRHFAKWVSAVILMIGFMMAGWTEKKQALHDMMAATLVVRGAAGRS